MDNSNNTLDQLKYLLRHHWYIGMSQGPDDTVTGGWRVSLGGWRDFEAPEFEDVISQAYLFSVSQATAEAIGIRPVAEECPRIPQEACETCSCYIKRPICSRSGEPMREVCLGCWQCKPCNIKAKT